MCVGRWWQTKATRRLSVLVYFFWQKGAKHIVSYHIYLSILSTGGSFTFSHRSRKRATLSGNAFPKTANYIFIACSATTTHRFVERGNAM